MRSVVVNLGLLALSLGASGCRGCGKEGDPAAPSASAKPPLESLPPPRQPWRPGVDCDKLLGVERASKAMGRPLVATPGPTLAASECRYAASATDNSAYVDVIYACRESAASIARSVMTRLDQGAESARLGQQSVVFRDGDKGVVQLLHKASPCAVQVSAEPADKVLDLAREVESSLAGTVETGSAGTVETGSAGTVETGSAGIKETP